MVVATERSVMKLGESKLGRTIFARLDEDEDLLDAITLQAKESRITAGFFLLIGTLKEAKLGFYRHGKYEAIKVPGPLEIVSCLGNVSVTEQDTIVHAHISVADEKGTVLGGHLLKGCPVSATGELILIETPDTPLRREFDEQMNLYLWSSK